MSVAGLVGMSSTKMHARAITSSAIAFRIVDMFSVSAEIDSMCSNVSIRRTARYSFLAPLGGVKFGFIY